MLFSDVLRVMIIGLLNEEPLTAAELSARLDVSADRVRSNLRRLLEIGAVTAVSEEPRRGVVQRYYVSDERFALDDDEYEKLDLKQRRALNSSILRLSFAEAIAALFGQSPARADPVVARTPMLLDEEGWAELSAIHHVALDKVLELHERMAGRFRSGDDGTFLATSVLICFEEA